MKQIICQAPVLKKKFSFGTEALKGVITISVIALCFVLFLFGNIISKNHLGYGSSVSFKGYDLLQMMFNGGEYMDYVTLPEIEFAD